MVGVISQKMRRLTLFDIDGTLSNNTLEHNRAFSEAFRKEEARLSSLPGASHTYGKPFSI